jgi:replicative DNA helicase
MPESPEAEAAVLGSMIVDRECIGDVVQALTVESFYRPEHRMIFEALVHLYEANSAIDLVTLRDQLKKRNELDSSGGVEYLVRVAEAVPSAASVEYYATIVKEKAMLRQLATVAGEILQAAYSQTGEVSEMLDAAEQKVFAVTEQNLLTETFENIESRKEMHITGLETQFYELDEMLCGLQKGEMIIIAGRPSMGKTSFALNIAENVGANSRTPQPVVIFSLEMGRHQLVERILCSQARIDSQLVRKGLLSSEQYAELTRAGSELYDKPIFIDDTAGMTPLEIRAKCRRLKSQHNIQGVFIDYLQLMSLSGRTESRQQEISTISRQLKALARELSVPVVVLSQLNRSPEEREGHRPRMSDLRESGSLEQDADVVLLLHREDYYHRGESEWDESHVAEVIVAKQRNGPTGVVQLTFNEKITRFENLSHATEAG